MRKRLAFVILVWGMAGITAIAAEEAPKPAAPAPSTTSASPGLATDEQKIAYTIGFLNGSNTLRYRLRPEEWAAYMAGFEDGRSKKTSQTDTDTIRPKIQQFMLARDAEGAAENKKVGAAFLEKAAAEPGARKTASGLVIRTVKEGQGASPSASDQVKVKYRGSLADGTEFDNSDKHGGSATFGVSGVIPCWTEALQMMKVGETAELNCPPEIAYGDRGAGPRIPGGSALKFTVELLEIVPPPGTAAPAIPPAQ
jgi:FKBP-type peptidyl-prolyl cis-trans isomerase